MSSNKDAIQFENGSGDALITNRLPDFVAWVVAANPPPKTPAAIATAGFTSPTAPAAKRTPLWVSLIIIMFIYSPLFAEGSWLNKGSELLKSVGIGSNASELTVEEIGAGLKDALKVGSDNVVGQLGAKDGFNTDSNIHIPLPPSLNKVKTMLSKVGMSSYFEDVELKLNRAYRHWQIQIKIIDVGCIVSKIFYPGLKN